MLSRFVVVAMIVGVLAGCSSAPPPPEPEAVKSELQQLDEARDRERSNK